MTKNTLIVPAFRIRRFGQTFVSSSEIAIDLRSLEPGSYRVIAVHNFLLEDRNPNLDECVAGVFLAAGRGDGRWTEPESFPIECRTVAILGEVDVHRPSSPSMIRP
jgi:hypothetical protein